MPIKLLEPQVVSRIAAGEVVERPASVVKELVENALDAGSTHISVAARNGGISLISVTDNGTGIPSAETELAFARYATSKINDFADLESIGSLGFRGEALPSIAVVAEVEMVTCAADDSAGTYLSLKDGVVVDRSSRGRSRGTTVTVRNLFRQVPARLKFLKEPTTENSHIARVVTQYALAFPGVKFTLLIDGRTTLSTPGSGRLIDSITQIYGMDVARQMLPIKEPEWQGGAAADRPVVTGMIGAPTVARSHRGYLSLFVNQRWINSRMLARAVEEAYHGLLMTGKHPVAIISISLPPGEVDVNIHPTKLEVKFRNEGLVFTTVQRAVRRTLIEQALVPRIEEVATAYASPVSSEQASWLPAIESGSRDGVTQTVFQTPTASLPALRVLGQLLSSYIVAEGPDGLYIVDQHAAHERVCFEKVKQQRLQQGVEAQGLLEPSTFEVSPQQEEVLKSYYKRLSEFGFSVEPFGIRTYLVRAVPLLLYDRDWAAMLRELLDSLSGEETTDWIEKAAISLACHSAVRAGQVLTNDEMRELIRQLEQVAVPNTCPHGRPTIIRLDSAKLRREFSRS
jgi:DNA mismatch repair protein MutL